ncbi:hypothetical protein BC1002_7093 (plasmid) [Paraburkholderia atlantica]|uniref:Uncharacterized protein n=2 Tax=Paraburkholderia atlantica TaxID=2654982 RepID=D5WNG7_PARAM|nr:hypothetical protein BC1002_7093 [Paraburkholderia atlantica]
MLRAARKARNYVAHYAVDELKLLGKVSNGIERWHEVMASKLQDIPLGKIIVAVLLSRNSAEETPTQDAVDAYPAKIALWVVGKNA